jgi:hypothetical protein
MFWHQYSLILQKLRNNNNKNNFPYDDVMHFITCCLLFDKYHNNSQISAFLYYKLKELPIKYYYTTLEFRNEYKRHMNLLANLNN